MKENLLREILREYDAYRLREEQSLRKREEEVLTIIPELADCRNRFISAMAERAKSMLKGSGTDGNSDHMHAPAGAEDLKSLEAAILVKHGYPADYLTPHYRCPICKDTGFTGELVREKCSCLVQQLVERMYRSSDTSIIELENFDTFNEEVFPDTPMTASGLSQREYMRNLKTLLMEYKDAYPDNPKKNILFTGKTGLGKTFLLNCLAKSIIDKGYTVLKITSYNLFEHLFNSTMNDREESQVLKDRIFSVDTLIIDDLGTETKRNNFTAEELFNILNERYLQKQHTFLSTNLSLSDLRDCYSDRVTSRLFDTQSTMIIRFIGQDIRLMPK